MTGSLVIEAWLWVLLALAVHFYFGAGGDQ